MSKSAKSAFKSQHGQRLQGRKTHYNVTDRLGQRRDNIWLARDPDEKIVLVKTAPWPRLKNEIEALELCRGNKYVRQLLDVADSPQSLVLEYLDKNLYEASCEQQLGRQDVKRVAKAALEGLMVLHDNRRAHTGQSRACILADSHQISTKKNGCLDIKPDNLLANLGTGEFRFGDIKLADLGDSVPEDISTNTGQHIISAPIYRAPEVMPNVRWTTAVDICSLGAAGLPEHRGQMFLIHPLERHREDARVSSTVIFDLSRSVSVSKSTTMISPKAALALLTTFLLTSSISVQAANLKIINQCDGSVYYTEMQSDGTPGKIHKVAEKGTEIIPFKDENTDLGFSAAAELIFLMHFK
ncbi:hypothetical protein MMC25_002876 [Agyrium rufum]|nr:hypothetical protein [Agyrium rufum]